mmetsp:Transcript_889/g.2134  ORF Transcript_889/g.2134 Transcript_889/m.2134 type:complete len:262 (-) Transcript_889:6456-7241(-)
MICTFSPCLFLLREVQEMSWPVALVVELAGVLHAQAIFHGDIVLLSHEVVVPYAVVRHHEKAKENVTQEHLHLLSVRGQEAGWVCSRVLVRLAPLEALWGNAVGCQGATARGEAARDDDGLVCQPGLVVGEHPRMECDVLRAQVRLLVWLCVDPTQRLEVPQMVVVGQLSRQRHGVVGTHLRHHDHASNLLHLGVVWRRNAVEVCRYLRPQVTDADEGLQDVLGHHVRVACLADVLAIDVEVVCPDVQGRGADGPDSPLCA